MEFSRGMRDKLEKYVNVQNEIEVTMQIVGAAIYDYCCFGVDSDGKLSDDRYMIFYNQTSSPNSEIRYTSDGAKTAFGVKLESLPSHIDKLIFTASIDGNGTMGDIASHTVNIAQNGTSVLTMSLQGMDFKSEKAIISIEIYRKNGWRIGAVANGFNGGLSALLAAYGGEEIKPQEPIPVMEAQKAEVPKEKAPDLTIPVKKEKISLKKGQKVSLSKNTGGTIIVENGWAAKGKDYDLKALVRYRDGRQIYIGAANRDEYLSTPDGAVKHGGDVKNPGDLEHIDIVWNKDIASVAVSSYSAIENGTGSFQKYGVFVRIKNGKQVIEILAADASANDRSYTLCFGEIIYGTDPGTFEVSALEMYSKPNSENRIGYRNGVVVMDIGPRGKVK